MAELIPREVLFGNPERISPHISPDGTRLAWIAPRDGVLNVWVAPIGASGADWDAAASGFSPGPRTAGICCTCRTPAGTRTGGCTTSTWNRPPQTARRAGPSAT